MDTAGVSKAKDICHGWNFHYIWFLGIHLCFYIDWSINIRQLLELKELLLTMHKWFRRTRTSICIDNMAKMRSVQHHASFHVILERDFQLMESWIAIPEHRDPQVIVIHRSLAATAHICHPNIQYSSLSPSSSMISLINPPVLLVKTSFGDIMEIALILKSPENLCV